MAEAWLSSYADGAGLYEIRMVWGSSGEIPGMMTLTQGSLLGGRDANAEAECENEISSTPVARRFSETPTV